MNAKTKARFDAVWALTNRVNPRDIQIAAPMKAPLKDALKAVENGIAVKLPRGTAVTGHYFSLMEMTKIPPRRRPITWAKNFNEMCEKKGYKAELVLNHVSHYLPRALQECGATYDAKAGFFQLPLPKHDVFTFIDENGDVYGLTRLPMGISTAPELMQIVMSVLSGDPLTVLPEFKSPALVDVWIDNVMFTGSKSRVDEAAAQFKSRMAAANATINEKDSCDPSTNLEFIGVNFDFANSSVSLGKNNKVKLDAINTTLNNKMEVAELETATARMMYASSVLGVQLSGHFWALKFMRRILSKINRGVLKRSDTIEIPPSSLAAYRKWALIITSTTTRKITHAINSKTTYTLWCDASNLGWGAVLINNNTQQVQIVANKWTAAEAKMHINCLEARALFYALSMFEDIKGATVFPMIDNTSVVATTSKGYSKSEGLNNEIHSINEVVKKRRIDMRKPTYVKSANNLADPWSRNFG